MDTSTLSPAGVGPPHGAPSPPGSQQHDGHGDRIDPTRRSSPIGSRDCEFQFDLPGQCGRCLECIHVTARGRHWHRPRHHHGTSTTTTLHHHRPNHHGNSSPSYHVDPNTPYDHHHDQPTATRHLHPITPRHHRHDHHRSLAPLHRSPQRRGRDQDHHLDGDDPQWTFHHRRQTTTTTSPGALPSVT